MISLTVMGRVAGSQSRWLWGRQWCPSRERGQRSGSPQQGLAEVRCPRPLRVGAVSQVRSRRKKRGWSEIAGDLEEEAVVRELRERNSH